MSLTHGMNVAEVEDLGRFLHQRADRLDRIVSEINRAVYSVHWQGGVAVQFGQQYWPKHRARLQVAARQLHDLGQAALNNGAEQRQASDRRGTSSALPMQRSGMLVSEPWAVGIGLTTGGASLGRMMRNVNDVASVGGSVLNTLDAAKKVPIAGKAGVVAGAYGKFVDGYSIGEELAQGKYVDAGLSTGLLAGDLAADHLKTKGPVAYGIGVAVQSWVEVGREARNVDWSAGGMRAIHDASLAEWTDAFGYAAKQMPLKLVKIFSF